MPTTSPRVLVIRLDAVGDALALAPLLAALRERGVSTDLVLTERNRDALSSRAAQERFVAPFAQRDGSPENRAAIARFGARLRERGYTHALIATEDPGGYRLARAVAAPRRIGFANGWGKPFKTLWVTSQLTRTLYRSAGLDPRAPHECAVLFRLGETLLGREARPTRDPRVLRPLVIESEPAPDSRVAFQVTDKWERLGIDFDDVVRCARGAGDVRALAPASEADYAARFERATGIAVKRFAALESWKCAIAAARALIAPDSGAIHVAGMTGTPVVVVFARSEFALQSARWSPWAAPYRAIEATADWPERALKALAALYAQEAAGQP